MNFAIYLKISQLNRKIDDIKDRVVEIIKNHNFYKGYIN